MLHKRVRDQDEVAGQPAPQRYRHRRHEMVPWPEALLAPDERADERTLQKEGEHAFHCERLSDHTAGVPREVCPVGTELELHCNIGDDTHGEIEPEQLAPEPDGVIVLFVTRPQRTPFPVDQEPRQSHGELREEMVIGQREPELQPAPEGGIGEIRVHCCLGALPAASPDELEAMIESGGVASCMSANSLILKSGRSGPFSCTKSAASTSSLSGGLGRRLGLAVLGAKLEQPEQCRVLFLGELV